MKRIFSLMIVVLFSLEVYSQGCSDAGFCTVGNIHPNIIDSSDQKSLKCSLFLANGIGDEGVYVFTPGIQFDFQSSKNLSFQSKLTANYAAGNLGNVLGLGDLFLSSSYLFSNKAVAKNSITAGFKFPLNNGDLKFDGNSLPMQYQSSLGTIDFIIGYNISIDKVTLNIAWQQPLTKRNSNSFLYKNSNSVDATKYTQSNIFNRKGDVLFRLGYNLISNKKWNWNSSLLAIYHLNDDSYENKKLANSRVSLDGSKGLTVNITSLVRYNINKKWSVGFFGGVPVVVRKIRPDGLTRTFSISPEVIVTF